MIPRAANLNDLFRWITNEGRREAAKDLSAYDRTQYDEDDFTVYIEFDSSSHLVRGEGSDAGTFAFSIPVTRKDLETFRADLVSEYLDCQENRNQITGGNGTL